MTKYVEAGKLLEWVNKKNCEIRNMIPNQQDKFRGMYSDLEILIENAIEFDGWCSDLSKAPMREDYIIHGYLGNDPFDCINVIGKVSPIEGVILSNGDILELTPLSFRPIPKKESE